MIILFVVMLICTCGSLVCLKRYRRLLIEKKCKYGDTGSGFGCGLVWFIVSFIIAFIFFLAFSINNTIDHKNDYNNLRRIESNKKIFNNKYQAVGTELKSELNKYPLHEKDIFDKISPDKVNLYFVKYPELKSVESITLLAQQLASLQSRIYDTDLEYNNVVLIIKKRQENKWWYCFWLKTYDVNFK